MNIDKNKLDNSRGYQEGSIGAVDSETANFAASYKKDVSRKYISMEPDQIDERLAGTTFFVSRKYDGELAVLFWNGKECFSVNSGGKVRMGLPCIEEAAKRFKAAKLKSAVIPAELYRCEESGRTRVSTVLAALADKTLHNELRLALFDIVSIDGEPFRSTSYEQVHKKLSGICVDSKLIHVVRCETANSRQQVKDIFVKWVDDEGSEGLVVRSELPIVYKLKNCFTLDAAIVGFSEGSGDTKEQIRTLLVALMTEDGHFQVIGRCPGSGLDMETRKKLYPKLLKMKIKSDYTEIDSNNVAFHMIRPEIIAEVKVNDLVFENNSGPIFDPLLSLKDGAYHRERNVHGISLVHPVFSMFREDKKANVQDIRASQISEISCNPFGDGEKERGELPKSELIKREVYKKTQGEKLMVQKFLVWKTNKEVDPGAEYPAYVFAYTDFSSDRVEALKNEVRVSNSKEQILSLFDASIEKNIKKGWEKV